MYSSNDAEISHLIDTLGAYNEGAAYYLNSSISSSAASNRALDLNEMNRAEEIAFVGIGDNDAVATL